MNEAYLCLGANLGDPVMQITQARDLIAADPEIELLASSQVLETEPYGLTEQPRFHNQVLWINTNHQPEELLRVALRIEHELGRVRAEKWGPRVIDIDLLHYNDLVLNTETLSLPHPDLHNRAFALRLLCEVAPGLVHPIFHKSYCQLLRELESTEVKP